MNDIEQVIERIQNKIKRSSQYVWVYFIKGKFAATTQHDENALSKLVGVYDSRLRTYQDEYVDQDIRWAAQHMKSFRA